MSVPPRLSLDDLLAHAGWVRDLAAALVSDPGGADDLVQETWIAALRRPPARGRSPRPWLARVMQNLARNRWRGETRRARREIAAARYEALPGSDEVAAELELQRVLVDALSELDEPTRATIVLRYFRSLSSAEIARAAGEPESTARNRLKRGLDALRMKLDRKYGDRKAWIALLMPAARRPPVAPTAAGITGGVAVGILSKSLAALIVAAFASAWFWQSRPAPARYEATEVVTSTDTALPTKSIEAAAPIESEARTVVAPLAAAATASEPKAPVDGRAFLEARVVDADHLPIPGAELTVVDRSERGEIERSEAPRTIADSAGRVRLAVRRSDRSSHRGMARLPPDEWTIGIEITARDRSIAASHPRVAHDKTTDLGDVVLVPAGAIEGSVVTEDGSPLPRKLWVEVVLPDLTLEERASGERSYRSTKRIAHAIVDERGKYLVRSAQVGTYRLLVAPNVDGWLEPFSEPFEVRAGEVARPSELVIKKNSSAVSGVLRAFGDPPVRQLSLLSRLDDPASDLAGRWLNTGFDEQGRFAIDLQPGSLCDLYARGTGQEVGEVALHDVAAGTSGIVLSLPEPSFLALRVVDEKRDPIPRFAVEVSLVDRGSVGGNSNGRSGNDPDGRMAVLVTAVPSMLSVSADGHVAKEFGPFDLEHHPSELEVVLEPLSELRGRVLAGGSPIEGASIELRRVYDPEATFAANGFPARLDKDPVSNRPKTDASGRFALTERRPGTYVIIACAEGFATAETEPFRHDPAIEAEEQVVELRRGGTVDGRVVVAHGASRAGIVVGISRGDGHLRTVRTDEEGRFRFDRLAAGRWAIRRCEREEGNSGRSEVGGLDPSLAFFDVIEGDTTRCDLDLRDAECRLRGRLPEPLRDRRRWTLTLTPVMQWRGESSQVGEDGRFDVEASVLGPHTLVLADAGADLREQRIEEQVDLVRGANAWSLELPTGTLIGEAPPGVLLVHTWTNPRGTKCTTRFLTDAEGRFRVSGVPAGKGEVATVEPTRASTRTVDVPAGGELVISVR